MERLSILVTGGAGFVGSHLVDALVADGHRVRVLDRLVPQVHPSGAPAHLNPAAELRRGDVADPGAVNEALEGIDAVFHLAAEVGVGQSMYEMRRYVEANSLGTATLLEGVVERRGRIRKLVVAASNTNYGEGAYRCAECGPVYPPTRRTERLAARRWEPDCPTCGRDLAPVPTPETKPLCPTSVYAITKQDQEQLCLTVGRAYDIPTVALRFFNIYGPRQALGNPYTGVGAIFSSRILNGNPPLLYEDGEQTRDLIHVSDVVRAVRAALTSEAADFEVINVGTGRPTSVRRLAELIAGGLGSPLRPEITHRYREGDIRHCIADRTKAGEILGWEPSVTIEDGIPELLQWVRQQRAGDGLATAAAELESRRLVR